jgi:arylsulfatase A-like enzyme
MATFEKTFPEQPFVNEKADARTEQEADEVSLGYRSQPTPHAAFAAMVARMDRDIGSLLELLKARGLDQRTLVMFTSDNGPHREGGADPAFFNSTGGLRGMKRDLYEGGIRVPMIARWSGTIPAGRTSDHVWAHWDVLPTLADLAGAKTPRGIDGISVAGTLRGGTQSTHEFLYWEFHERGFQQAVRMGRWKAVRVKQGEAIELYDLTADGREERNVAAAQPQVVARIEKFLDGARTDSPYWPPKASSQ